MTPALSPKLLACEMAFWPVEASSTRSTSCGARWTCLRRDARDLLQLLHQVELGLEAARGVDEQQVGLAAFLAGADGVEDHGARIRAGFMGDDLDAGAFAPDLQLVDGRGAEGVGGGQYNFAPALLVPVGHLADGGRLAGAVDADHHDHGKRRGSSMCSGSSDGADAPFPV